MKASLFGSPGFGFRVSKVWGPPWLAIKLGFISYHLTPCNSATEIQHQFRIRWPWYMYMYMCYIGFKGLGV